MDKTLNIGLLGLGVVGSGVVEVLARQQEKLRDEIGIKIQIVKSLVRVGEDKSQIAKKYGFELVTDIQDIISDPNIDVVVELIGKVHPAKEFITQALENGKHVVTANKDLIAQHGVELNQVAKSHQVSLFYEASVAGGIPILRTMTNNYLADEITNVLGIVNGTTNYMLTKMLTEGLSYDEALQKAQELGFAESNPTNDVDGIDAAYKMVILSQFAYGMDVKMSDLSIEGIRQVSAEDVAFAKKAGYEIKLIGRTRKIQDAIEVSVGPTLVSVNHPLASIKDEYNGVYLESTGINQSMFYGPGAGALPTATSVVSDLLAIAINRKNQQPAPLFNNYHRPTKLLHDSQIVDRYYLYIQTNQINEIVAIISEYKLVYQQQSDEKYQVILNDIAKDKLQQLIHKLSDYATMIRVMKVIETK